MIPTNLWLSSGFLACDPTIRPIFSDSDEYLDGMWQADMRLRHAEKDLEDAHPAGLRAYLFWEENHRKMELTADEQEKWKRNAHDLLNTPPPPRRPGWKGLVPQAEPQTLSELSEFVEKALTQLRELYDPRLPFAVNGAREALHNAHILLEAWRVPGRPRRPQNINNATMEMVDSELSEVLLAGRGIGEGRT